jgi:putative copper export protein
VSTVSVPATHAAIRATRLVRAAAIVAVVALALWVGGLVALGACAAPLVFGMVPAPWSGDAMGAVFRRFDGVAITCAVVVLGCEAIRLWAAPSVRPGRPSVRERARGLFAVVAALAAIFTGVQISPRIVALHAAGAVRGLGAAGLELERIHRLAETLGKIEVTFGLLVLILQILTLDPPKDEGAS